MHQLAPDRPGVGVPAPVTIDDVVEAGRRWLSKTLPMQVDGGPDDGGFDVDASGWCDGREAAFILAHLAAARSWAERFDVDPAQLDDPIRRATAFVLRRQHPDGRIDLAGQHGANEVGFTLPALVEAHAAIARLPGGPLDDVLDDLKTYLRRGAEAVVAGEAYTANHRWAAACAPLAAVQTLWPDDRYLEKIEGYLADGIDCADDGAWFEERSPNYNMVANHGLLVMARCLDRPDLAAHVLRAFEFVLHAVQPNGEADSTFSHRQDRALPDRPVCTFGLARRAAQLSGDGRLTSLAHDAWHRGPDGFMELMPVLFEIDRHPDPLPAPQPLPRRYERLSASCSVARVRRDDTSLTVAADPGGHFFDTVKDQWGGARRSDSWFHLHHGDVVIETVHLAVAGMANVQPQRIEQAGPGRYALSGHVAGWTHTLHFRPGRREIHMPWDWSHEIEVTWDGDRVHLRIESDSPHALQATLHVLVRPGALIETTGAAARPAVAGEALEVGGEGPLVLRSDSSAVALHGLPSAEHRQVFRYPPAIPSTVYDTCCDLTLGLRLPVALDLTFELFPAVTRG